MSNSKEKMFTEALKRLTDLEKQFGLRPNIYKYFKEGKLYYSYLVLGISGCIDTINSDVRYAKIVEEFEEKYGHLVYHVIEAGNMIALLYVGCDEEEWETEVLLDKQYLASYVYNLDNPQLSEFGDIVVSSSDGVLVRVA